MAKYRYGWDQQKYERYLREGRGKGTKEEYKPWITIHDFPSKGFSTRGRGWKSLRIFHCMSKIELNYYYLLEWSDIITDIREQYPLLDLDDAMNIAEELGIKYPVDNNTKTPIILTTDFFITLNIDGKEVHVARTTKPASELDKKRVIEKYEVERIYWLKRGIDWGICTERDIPEILVENINWVHTHLILEPFEGYSVQDLLRIGEILKYQLSKSGKQIKTVTDKVDFDNKLEPGTALTILRHLIAKKEVKFDMLQGITVTMTTDSIKEIKMNDGSVMTG